MRVDESRAAPESARDLPAPSPAAPPGRRFVFVVDRESIAFGAAIWILPSGAGKLTFTRDHAVIKGELAGAFGTSQLPPDDVRLAPGETLLIFGQGSDLMIEALATYSNLRHFTVTTSAQIEQR
jgi:hypothetical protein